MPARRGVYAVELEDGPELTGIDHRLDPTVGGLAPAVVSDLHHDAGATRRLGDAFRVGHRQREWLLDEDVLPGLRRSHRDVRVRGVRGRHKHAIDVRIREQLVEIRRGPATVLLGERRPRFLGPRVAGDHLGDARRSSALWPAPRRTIRDRRRRVEPYPCQLLLSEGCIREAASTATHPRQAVPRSSGLVISIGIAA